MKKFTSILMFATLGSQIAFAGPLCDSLSSIQSQKATCDHKLSIMKNENYQIEAEINKISDVISSGRIDYDLQICKSNVTRISDESRRLDADLAKVKSQAQSSLNQLHAETRLLNSMTAYFQCVGMDRKNAITYMVTGRDETEARRNLENPPVTGLDGLGLQERQTFMDMKRKHGIYSYCVRVFNGEGSDPIVTIDPVQPGVPGGPDVAPGVGPVIPGVPGFGEGNPEVIPGVGPA